MKLKNKKTGEIVVFGEGIVDLNKIGCKNVAEMMEQGWEDYEKPKEYWCIDWTGVIRHIIVLDDIDKYEENKKEIGNYFETKEEAEKAVEKLKAWKRLKDRGFEFRGYTALGCGEINFIIDWEDIDEKQHETDMKLLFGGEE